MNMRKHSAYLKVVDNQVAPHVSNESTDEPFLLNETWLIINTIGNGSFGKIFRAKNITDDKPVAIKITNLLEAQVQQLRIEHDILKRMRNCDGISNVYYFGRVLPEGTHFCMVMDYLGPNLEDLFNYCDRKFSIKTICMLAIQMLMRIEQLHAKKIIHRDIKPENFVMGRGPGFNRVYVIDFGLSRSFLVPGTDEHIPFVQTKRMMGTARYCSINSHLGLQLSRRDDIEALGYIFVYFANSFLPWQGISAGSRVERFRLIHQKKSATATSDLCSGLPIEFNNYLSDAKSLAFAEEPNYTHLRSCFYKIMFENGYSYDNDFDWLAVYAERHQISTLF